YRYFGGAGPMQMPVPLMNVVNGGAHANNNLDMQEFMIVPVGMASFREALRCGAEVFASLRKIIDSRGMPTTVGDEGGFAPNLPTHAAAIELILEAVYKDGKYVLESENLSLSSQEFSDYLANLADKYPIVSIEDGMGESDWAGWKLLTARLGKKLQIVGDDVFVTNTGLLREGVRQGAANAILVKVNQIGTLSETFAA